MMQANDDKSLTGATAIWTTDLSRPIQAAEQKQNFTYVYYVARLPNASIASGNTASATNYNLTGTWNLATVTSTVTIITDENGTITHIHRDQDVSPLRRLEP